MADAVVSVVVEQIATILKEQIQNEVNLVRGVENEIKSLSKELENVRIELEDAGRKQFAEEGVKAWLVRLADTFYEMEDVLDEWQIALRKFQIQQQQQSNSSAPNYNNNKVCSFISCLCFQKVVVRHDIGTKIKNVKDKLDLILGEKDRYGLDTSTATTEPPPLQRETISSVDLAEVEGRDIDRDVVASKIFVTEDERQLVEIVSIVGVGGVGKTTLAQMVFNDSRVKDCFELSIWICVSDPFDVVMIVKRIVERVTRSYPESNQLEVLVQNHLKECISGKKFLLVLDDVWTEDRTKWELLKSSLKSCCGMGSKILVTTRKEMVAKTLDTLENGIYRVGVLSDESCWLLLKRVALFGRDEEECAKYRDIGMGIVDKCKGLPLAVKTLGSLLRCKNNSSSLLEEWEKVLKSEVWKLENAQVEIFPHLLLSYNELSPALKRCFSYCAIFPKDSRIFIGEVIDKWMTLGYLGYAGADIDMEDRGRQYFDNLAMRSLFQDFEKTTRGEGGRIYSFKLHDIVHEFAQYVRKNGTAAAAAAVLEAAGTNKKKIMCCSPELVSQVKQYRSFFWDENNKEDSLIICGCCLGSLWVLSLRNYWRARIPKGIEKLIHLRWLDLSESRCLSQDLETICNELLNLETLLLSSCKLEQIPRGIGNLIRLRHLDLSWNESLKELPSEIGNLIRLRHVDLRRNKCIKDLPSEIGNLVELRHLDLQWNESLKELPSEIGNLIRLRHLNLNRSKSIKELPREIGNLVELRHLDLRCNKLKELPENICGLGELEILDISWCDLLSKLPQEIHRLQNLKHLLINHTPSLRQFPQGISNLTSLRTLHEFRVGKDMCKLGWLKDLNRLGGDLKLVINLTGNINMDVVEDAREGELRKKEYLLKLEIEFLDDDESDGIKGVEEEDCVWVDVLDALQPHPNLQSLTIDHFKGSRLPSWIASPLNQVKTILLYDFGHLSSILLPLGKLPCLELIHIDEMHELRFVGREFLGGGITTTTKETTSIVFPKLWKLTFHDCPKWEEWEDNINAQEEEEDNENVASFLMPHLTELNINKCNSLAALPHRLLRKVASSSLKLDISGSTQLEQRYGRGQGRFPIHSFKGMSF